MKPLKPMLLIAICLGSVPVRAIFAVHDSVAYVQDTVKAVQDQTFQQLNLDYLTEQVTETKEILKTSTDTLETCKDTLETAREIYDTAQDLRQYIGDPMAMVRYLNSRFWYSREIDMMLLVTKEALSMADSEVVGKDEIEHLLKTVGYAGRVMYENWEEELARAQKKAVAMKKNMEEYGRKVFAQLEELNSEDQKFKGRDATLNEVSYANYRTNIYQANTLSQMLAIQTQTASMEAEQIYQQNARRAVQDVMQAQEIHDRYELNREMTQKRANQLSIGNAFIETYMGRTGI